MANPNQVLGQAKIKVDGMIIETDGQATLELGGSNREDVPGDYQAGNFRESTAPSKLDCSILIKRGVSLTGLREIDNATVTFEADTGQTYIIRNAYVSETISAGQGDGKAKVVFQGPPAQEL